jgi:mRNA interferase RelE/StbE
VEEREIKFHSDAKKFLIKTDNATFERLSNALDDLKKIPPEGNIKQLHGKTKTFRSRVGKYRIIYSIEDNIIYVRDIDSRGQVYKGGF